jgi:hypothetical protein
MNNIFTQMTPHTTLSAFDVDKIARRRAAAKLGWLIHASVYLAVNAPLIAVSLMQGKAWAAFPLAGWGLGLAIHGAVVWLASPGGSVYERLVQQERERLSARRDPW